MTRPNSTAHLLSNRYLTTCHGTEKINRTVYIEHFRKSSADCQEGPIARLAAQLDLRARRALRGFLIPPLMGAATELIGGADAYARGFLPFAVLIAIALPVVAYLNRWSARHHITG